MVHINTESSQFTDLLCHFDRDLAHHCRAQGCPDCGERLHLARYPRKPRGLAPLTHLEGWCLRWSYCCAQCRARTTPPSLCFLGQRVYVGAVVALTACMQQGLSVQRVAALNLVLEVPRRTLKRWRLWWQEVFVHSAFWRLACARLMPPVAEQQLPLSLLERFAGTELGEQLAHLLNFISPLSTRARAHAV
jgi:hypothetical protein